MITRDFWFGRKVFITGHTGFKGSWLILLLHYLGAEIHGFALAPPTMPNLYGCAESESLLTSKFGDVRDLGLLTESLNVAEPEVVIHLAAQSLVRKSYVQPEETYSTNVMGTVNLLEAVRSSQSVKAVIVVTSDKCYENRETFIGYREYDSLGGDDPYSSSKACAELVAMAYRKSFLPILATARAGNVIGGGDWGQDRLVPDCLAAFAAGRDVILRNPKAVRPWQHVLEALSGYLILAEKLFLDPQTYAGAWNFGPDVRDCVAVEAVVGKLLDKWSCNCRVRIDKGAQYKETHQLRLDSSRARKNLGWSPCWNLEEALDSVVEWGKAYQDKADMRSVSLKQIEQFLKS